MILVSLPLMTGSCEAEPAFSKQSTSPPSNYGKLSRIHVVG
jgi:hypothetical protein